VNINNVIKKSFTFILQKIMKITSIEVFAAMATILKCDLKIEITTLLI